MRHPYLFGGGGSAVEMTLRYPTSCRRPDRSSIASPMIPFSPYGLDYEAPLAGHCQAVGVLTVVGSRSGGSDIDAWIDPIEIDSPPADEDPLPERDSA